MNMPRLLKTQKSITLTEVMVSIFLVSVTIGSILALMIQNMKMGQTIDYHYAAVNIAKSRMDRIRELRQDKGFNNLYTAAENNITVDRNGLPDSDGDFTRTTAVTANFDGNSNLTKVEVTIAYTGVSGVTVTLTSILSPYF